MKTGILNQHYLVLLTAAALLTGCGGGGGGGNDGVDPPIPAPSITISASPPSLVLGESTTVAWSTSNATSCTGSGDWSGSKATSGSQSITPASTGTKTYGLTCSGAGGSTTTNIPVTVSGAAPTVTIAVSPNSITTAQTATLSWTTTNATSCTASGAWSGSRATSGSLTVSSGTAGNYTYTLSCTGTEGTTVRSAILAVSSVAVTPVPAITIAASPSTVTQGSSTTLSWTTTNATSCTGTGAWSGSKATSGSQSVTPASTGSINYGLSCTGPGGSGSNSTTVTVNAPVTPAPTVSIGLSPGSITVGQNATLSWSSSNATSCTATGPASWAGSRPTSGSLLVTSSVAGSYTYTLSCSGAGGTTSQSTTLVAAASGIATGMTVSVVAGKTGGAGVVDGALVDSRFSTPKSLAIDSAGNTYVVDTTGHVVRKIDTTGAVSTFAGQAGLPGYVDGTGKAAKFRSPEGITVDSSDNLYVADSLNHCIRKITSAGVVSTLAGTCGTLGALDGGRDEARFSSPAGIAVGGGNVYVSDRLNKAIRRVDLAGNVTTYAGALGLQGTANGPSGYARFNSLGTGLVRASNGTLYLTDTNAIRMIDATGNVSVYAGATSVNGSTDHASDATLARFLTPQGLALDGSGNLYVADAGNSTVRKVAAGGGAVTTMAGTALFTGSADGTGAAARFNQATGVAVSGTNVIVADNSNHLLRRITSAGVVTTIGGQIATPGQAEGTGTAATFSVPKGIVANDAGTLYVVDSYNAVIRQIVSGTTSVLAGVKGSFGTVDGALGTGKLSSPSGLAIKADGSLIVTDGHAIRAITTAGAITTIAGSVSVNGTTDATGVSARFKTPRGVAVDADGLIYVADTGNCTVRKMGTDGAVTTLAGTAGSCNAVDGTGVAARFKKPAAITVDATGNLYVADVGNDGGSVIRKVTAAGVVTTLAGTINSNGRVDGTGAAARFGTITGLHIKSDGTLVVADSGSGTIRLVTAAGVVTTAVGGDGQIGERTGSTAPLPGSPFGVFALGTTLYWTTNHAVMKAQ